MSMKSKNPLYVVKGKQVEMAAGWLDLLIKKFDLEPIVAFLQQMLAVLLVQVQSYAVFVAVKEFIDMVMAQVETLTKKFGIA